MPKEKPTPMTKDAASRIQSANDKHYNETGNRSGFAARSQSAADRNANVAASSNNNTQDKGTKK
ncbi:hypothetical protein M9X92_011681 [Pyricularia oryzae]|nr:hypothetical protein M9X92_011681 [Pyricularia oryzae]